jgi:hypothetical protein
VKTPDFDKALRDFAEEVNLAAKRELGVRKIGKNRSYGVASRTLQKSLEYSIGNGRVQFGSPLPYATFLHWGVNGTQQKQPGAPYSYRYENPSKPHVKAIREWMDDKPVRLRSQTSGRFVRSKRYKSKRTGKEIDPKDGIAWTIARSVKRRGITGLRYYTVALETMVPRASETMGEALVNDLVKQFGFKAGPITIKIK